MSEDSTQISIPKPLAEKLKKRMEGTDFESLSEYISYILRQVISKVEAEEKERKVFSKEEEEKVKERLRNLGYID